MQTLSDIPVAPPIEPRSVADAVRGNFILLRADNLRLVLPQEEVASTDYMAARPVLIEGETGLLQMPQSTDAAVYIAVSSEMKLLDHCPEDRFVSTQLQGLDVRWCWSEVRVLIQAELHPSALPATLLSPSTPVREIVAVADEWAYMCSAAQLQQFALSQKG